MSSLKLCYIILNFSLMVLLVFLVITVGAQRVHYAKASLLVEYRLICSKAHRVVIGQTYVESE